MASVVSVTIGAFALAGCGATQTVRPKAIAFEPTIVACSGSPAECTSGRNEMRLRESREASNHLCAPDTPNVLVKADGTPVCVATLPSAGPIDIGVSIPSAVRARGPGAIGVFTAGERVVARTGCLACHRIATAGNNAPGPDLTRVGSRLPPEAIERALVASPAPMPSFSRLPQPQRRALAYFLAQLR